MQKLLKLMVLLAAAAATLSCVTPFYGTARIEPGWHADAGIAAVSFVGSRNYDQCLGLRADSELRYGFNRYLQANGCIGIGTGYMPPYAEPPTSGKFFPLLDDSLGFQAALPTKYVTPAMRLMIGQEVTVIPLVGIGQQEWLTFGCELTWFLFGPAGSQLEGGLITLFMTLHLSPQWSIFAGAAGNYAGLFLEYPLASIGVGYKLK